jgi:lipoprotein-anchoring transpeptidase ErfK/SrfK
MPIDKFIQVSLSHQHLSLIEGEELIASYPVSTSKFGAGEQINSECTPRGNHIVRAMIGHGALPNTVFLGRRPTGEIYDPFLAKRHPLRDWILTRIIWLSGCEPGKNRMGDVDSMRRYIYIHGTPDSEPMGVPMSHGCIRMRNDDVIDLFDRIFIGIKVNILE